MRLLIRSLFLDIRRRGLAGQINFNLFQLQFSQFCFLHDLYILKNPFPKHYQIKSVPRLCNKLDSYNLHIVISSPHHTNTFSDTMLLNIPSKHDLPGSLTSFHKKMFSL